MKYTNNFRFKKPEPLDVVNIEDINDSFDLLDTELKKQKDNNDTMLVSERERIIKEKERLKNEENRVDEFTNIKKDYDTYKNVMIAESNVAALQSEINKTNASLEQNAKKVYGKPTRPVKNVVTFYIDDAFKEDLTIVKPIADAQGIPITICGIASGTNQGGIYLTLDELRGLQDDGWEINSHTYNHVDLTKITGEELRKQLEDSRDYYENNGITCKSICYPYGYVNDEVMRETRKYYRAGLGSSHKANSTPINTYDIHRFNFDNDNLDGLKAKVDALNNQWAIIYFHTNNWTTETKQPNIDKLNGIIDYIQSKNILITTVDKALDIFENTLDIGDSSTNYFKIGADGKVDQKPYVGSVFSGDNSKITSLTPVTAFEKYKTTMTGFLGTENFMSPFTTGIANGGTLFTHRPQLDDGLSFQIFHTSDNQYILKRTWNNGLQSWNAFKVISAIKHKKEIYIDPVLANSSRIYDFGIVGLMLDSVINVTFETELPTGLVYTVSCPVAGTMRLKVYNVTSATVNVGVKNIYYTLN